MKIRKIQLINNSFFGDIEFDFVDDEGNIVDTIIVVGENGCGKTRLLNIIYEFSRLSTIGEVSSEHRRFFVELNNEEMEKILTHEDINKKLVRPTGEFVIEQDYTVRPSYWNRIKVKYYSCDENGVKEIKTIESSLKTLLYSPCGSISNIRELGNFFFSIAPNNIPTALDFPLPVEPNTHE